MNEQRKVYDTIINATNSKNGGVFFLYGQGDTGKTFLWKTLSDALRSKEKIVLNVASSGIISLLLHGGRTAHSRFNFPFNPRKRSTCNIDIGSPVAEVIIQSSLIIWDEAPMMHRLFFEALNKSMHDILKEIDPENNEKPFGEKTNVFGGDFRKILLVIPRGTRQDIINATINLSSIWDKCQVLRLTKNMRLLNASSDDQCVELKEFAEWITKIGDGKLGGPNEGHVLIKIPDDLIVKEFGDPLEDIVNITYPRFIENSNKPSFLEGRAILAPTLDIVESINEYMVSRIPGKIKTYFSCDSPCPAERDVSLIDEVHTTEYLNTIKCFGVPNHEIKLKVGISVMLLRNVDYSAGLCNGTRLIINKLGERVVQAHILSGEH